MRRLDIVSIEGKGELDKEVVWFEVKEQISSLKYYLLTDSTFTDDRHISNDLRHTYWFLDKAAKQGDYIALWTKSGTYRQTNNKRNTITHHFYWGIGRTVWNKDGDCAVLFKLDSWKTKRS